jgi:hypothetical protein
MTAFSNLRRLALLLAILPQLFVLGMGRGVVACIGSDGHVQLEVAGAECCVEAAALHEEAVASAPDATGCGACVDVPLVPDPRAARGSGGGVRELPAAAGFAVPGEAPAIRFVTGSARSVRRAPVRGYEPSWRVHLRSVVLRR